MPIPTLHINPQLEASVLAGHPWVYHNHLPPHRLRTGQWVQVKAGRASAYGLYDENSTIAIRLFGREEPSPASIAQKVYTALEWRNEIFGTDTNAYRLISGENDYLPGITVDKYERFAVLQTYADCLETVVPDVVKALAKSGLKGIVRRGDDKQLEALYGTLPPPELTVLENGLKIIANLYDGQKTGLFLDHRDNRALLERFCHGKTVLNLFAYTGAFSLYAARGGALQVESVDIAKEAMRDAARNFKLNGFDPEQHSFVAADCFALLEQYVQAGRQFDVVILDPPSLARSKDNRFAAARAYQKLNALALRCTREGGLFATASCTSQISPEAFKDILLEAAVSAKRRVQVVQENGQALDHPVTFFEGRYLKFVLARVSQHGFIV
jgi:23S rRNA (cytosine1962-C5)-methyltransferase